MYKNKADLQFAIMQAGDQAAAQVHATMAGHLARAAALWHLADAAATAGATPASVSAADWIWFMAYLQICATTPFRRLV